MLGHDGAGVAAGGEVQAVRHRPGQGGDESDSAAARRSAEGGANDRAVPLRRPPIALVLLALVLAVAATACDGVPFGMGRSANRYR
ncbi:MAG: hypothetical protein U0470_14930, partial [Anaerolineae bacterium]